MPRQTKDEYFLSMLSLVAGRSTCPRRAVGAIITDVSGHILSTGYNGVPSGVVHCTDTPCEGHGDCSGDSSRCWAVHAEQNAILQCGRLKEAHCIYVSVTPCFTCAKLIANTTIRRMVCKADYPDDKWFQLLVMIKGLDVIVAGKDQNE